MLKTAIGGESYTLMLTTKATREIAGRYGGLENLGEKLFRQHRTIPFHETPPPPIASQGVVHPRFRS